MARQPLQGAYVRIIEQPASKSLRFRYECEGRSAGSIPGVNSTSENRTYPTIGIYGYTGRAVIVVSCVTKDEPFKPHPHNLVGRDRCDRGVCTIKADITDENREYQFKNLGIQCVKKKDIGEALRVREELRVDPFRTGFNHRNQNLDLNAVRLCFQVFLSDEKGKVHHSLMPVVSDIIYDKKAMSELIIMRASHCSGSVRGGTQVILLCEKVSRDEIAVVFYQGESTQPIWEESAIIILVHKQVAIAFETPPYRNPNTSDHVNVWFKLKRIGDSACSNSLPFEYIPDYPDSGRIPKKRKTIMPILQSSFEQDRFQIQEIKSEPRDKTSPHHVSSSPLHVYPPQYNERSWGMAVDNMNLTVPGSSRVNAYNQDMQWPGPVYAQTLSPMHQSVSPNMQPLSPNMQPLSPNMQPLSPNMQPISPNMQPLSPNMQQMQNVQAISPNVQPMSPIMQSMSPMHRVSPNPMVHTGPAMDHMASNMQQPVYSQMQHHSMMDTQESTPSLNALLMTSADMPQFNSAELSGLSSLLGDRNPDLSDSLNKLPTSDLLM